MFSKIPRIEKPEAPVQSVKAEAAECKQKNMFSETSKQAKYI